MDSISGQWIAGEHSRQGTQLFNSVDPRVGRSRGMPFANATLDEVALSCAAARQAFRETAGWPAERFAAGLEAIAAGLQHDSQTLIAAADAETGLGPQRLSGEMGRTTGQLRAFAALLREGSYVQAIIDRAQPDRQPAPRPDLRRMRVALGPVAVFAASNFPFAFSVCGGDSASAWAAGCPVVVKAHPGHPETSALTAGVVTRALEEAGFPRGFFSLLQGDSTAVGQALVAHDAIEAVGFTGSLRGGRALFDAAAARSRPIPVYAEMGSVNPVIVLPGALAERMDALAEGLAGSVTLGSGQFCTNPGVVVLLESAEARAFAEKLAERMLARAPGVLLNEAVANGLRDAVARTEGSGLLTGIVRGPAPEGDAFCHPHTLMQTTGAAFVAHPALQQEHFGPVTLLVFCRDAVEREQVVEALHGSLTATVQGLHEEAADAAALFALLREKAGRLIWNGFPTGVEVAGAQVHGGPYPATTAPATTSVGLTAIERFMRPVAWQGVPDALLPPALQNANPLGILRWVDGIYTRESLG